MTYDHYIQFVGNPLEVEEPSYLDMALNKYDTVEDLCEYMDMTWEDVYNLIVEKKAFDIEHKYRSEL